MHDDAMTVMLASLRKQPKLWRADTVEDSLSLDRMQDLLQCALEALTAEGLALVPRSPSPREIQAWENAGPTMDEYFDPDGHFMASYRAFLAAADRLRSPE